MSKKQFKPEDISKKLVKTSHLKSMKNYTRMYNNSIKNPDKFWAKQAAERLTWFKKWNQVKKTNLEKGKASWFKGGKLNLCYNAIDRHLTSATRNKAALIWQGDNPDEVKTYTYQQLHYEVNRMANVLKNNGVKKGDVITIYLPMIAELAFSVLACARLGAIHSVIFAGFSADSIKNRILDADSNFIITADEGIRGGKIIPLKTIVDQALQKCPNVKTVLVVQRTGNPDVPFNQGRDIWYQDELNYNNINKACKPKKMKSEDPLFILYTSGSTGKPKGVVHTTAGYGLFTAMTHHYVFDHRPEDVYFCTADIGWITGHSYIIYGPLINGATSVMFEGVPTFPDAGRLWQIVDKFSVSQIYTAPTAIRALMRFGEQPLEKYNLKSLRILGSVGEPINSEAWYWYFNNIGKKKCPIVDTWWQTETGGIMLTPLPGVTTLKPSSATLPFFGVEPALLDDDNKELTGPAEGNLVIKSSWPAMARTVYGNHDHFLKTYFSKAKGYYYTGDRSRRDKDGFYYINGRTDDVINVSGHRLGTAEVESALDEHPLVVETAVVGYPHEIKGTGMFAFVTLKEKIEGSDKMREELAIIAKKIIGAIAKPDLILFTPALPKTRSGKIMRRILQKIAENEFDQLGDTSTLADPSVVEQLVLLRKELK